jgi:ribosomal protein S18 acetylase RimI-like enzyme
MLTIFRIDKDSDEMEIVRQLFKEYSNSLNENLSFQSFDEELENPLKKYGEPKGCLLLAFWNNEAAGCIALQPLKQKGVCEMKRLFVRNEYRNKGIGDELINELLKEATKKGYQKMVLDTLERLQPARRLYIKYGFVNTSPYYENPLADVVYMEKSL